MWYRRNPDVNQFGLHHLTNHTMWWASKGFCDLDYVPAFRGLGSSPLPKEEDYTDPRDWPRIQEEWDSIVRGQEFLRWMEDIFDEVRREIRPEAPSRIGNVLICPKLGVGFCRQPSAWMIKFPTQRNHVYQIDVTGTAITVNSEHIGTARQYGADAITKYGGGYSAKGPDFYYWKKDAARMENSKNTIRNIARDYWIADESEYVSDGLKETIVEGTAQIVDLIYVAGRESD